MYGFMNFNIFIDIFNYFYNRVENSFVMLKNFFALFFRSYIFFVNLFFRIERCFYLLSFDLFENVI